MPPAAIATPSILTDPGYLWGAPLGSTLPTNTVVGGVFTDAWPAAWLPYGATEDGSDFSYKPKVEAIRVAEFLDAIKYVTTEREGSFAFNLASWGLSNFRRALNGGVSALIATSGVGPTALYTVTPPAPGTEVRSMVGWESLDNTLRIVAFQTFNGGELKSSFNKAPKFATIPCLFNFEVPASGMPWQLWGAGASRA